ncbi:FecR family protein [Pedobacter metabolipauper]|uniref:FecR family protein n=1 Tax=Pedobacter metabolipauper TaxID=425513 RepID=A0A4R6SXP9_9SPHI|nr:FecR domain-containing protein [Pedobacter metabolipauper]TDQ09245.1 FecR family protein [Pedobacter metabolipauper]
MKEFETNQEPMYDLILEDLDLTISPEDKLLLQKWRDEDPGNEKIYQDFLTVQLNVDKLYAKQGYDPQLSWESLDRKLEQFDGTEKAVVMTPHFSGVVNDTDARGKSGDKTFKPAWNLNMISRIAAVLLVFVGVGYYLTSVYGYEVISTSSNAAMTQVVLPDGTQVNLNAATTIKYDKTNFLTNRKLELIRGEIFVQVVKHDAHQFSVVAAEVEAKDIGTSFNVMNNNDLITVIVEEGKVALNHASSNSNVLLVPGKLGIFDRKSKKLSATDNLDLNYKAWMDKKFIFQEMPLKEVVVQLADVYKMPIVIQSEALKSRKFTDRTMQYQTLDSALAVISASLQCKITKEKGTYVFKDN